MRSDEAALAGKISLFSNLCLTCLKMLAGFLGSSYALVADGIESLADSLSSFIVWRGLKVGSKAPDAEHPYGHGKAEAIATLIAGIGLFVSGGLIASQAVHEIIYIHAPPAFFTLPVLMGIIGAKEVLFRFLKHQAVRHDSGALLAEAWHHRSDSLTSLCVLAGLAIAVFAGEQFAQADDIAALLVTLLIFRNGWLILQPAIDELMDRRIEGEKYLSILKIIQETDGVLGVETLWIRRSGRCYHVDVHLEVDPEISVMKGHEIAHRVKDRLTATRTLEIQFVGTHVEPAAQG